jgi:D-lactate dehydrogenase (cytochrome)
VAIASQHNLPVIPFGAGSSVEGHVNAINGGISLDLGRMNKVLKVNAEDFNATVEAAVTRSQLAKVLENTGLAFMIDPGADATIGGMASTRASGTTTVKYGTMRENTLALTVVLPNGNVIKTGSRAKKSSAGYDLTHLFVGAEGTLGVITEVTLRLHTCPQHVAVATCHFKQIQDAVEAVIEIIQMDVPVSRIELLDDTQVRACNQFSKTVLAVAPTLCFEFHGYSRQHVTDHAKFAEAVASKHGGSGFVFVTSPEERARLWKARYDAFFATRALRPGCKIWTTDVCVPLSQLANCIAETKVDLRNASFPTTIVGHVGDGNFHVLCAIDLGNEGELAECEQLTERIVLRALRLGGTCSGEHGIGYGKIKYLQQEHGDAVHVMRALKRCLDPQNLMNPGKIFDV